MAEWIEPITDRDAGARMTNRDYMRICNNINYLYDAVSKPHTPLSTEWGFDVVTLAQFENILSQLETIKDAIIVSTDWQPSVLQTYENINSIEALILALYTKINAENLQYIAMSYSGDGIYASNVPYNYARPNRRN